MMLMVWSMTLESEELLDEGDETGRGLITGLRKAALEGAVDSLPLRMSIVARFRSAELADSLFKDARAIVLPQLMMIGANPKRSDSRLSARFTLENFAALLGGELDERLMKSPIDLALECRGSDLVFHLGVPPEGAPAKHAVATSEKELVGLQISATRVHELAKRYAEPLQRWSETELGAKAISEEPSDDLSYLVDFVQMFDGDGTSGRFSMRAGDPLEFEWVDSKPVAVDAGHAKAVRGLLPKDATIWSLDPHASLFEVLIAQLDELDGRLQMREFRRETRGKSDPEREKLESFVIHRVLRGWLKEFIRIARLDARKVFSGPSLVVCGSAAVSGKSLTDWDRNTLPRWAVAQVVKSGQDPFVFMQRLIDSVAGAEAVKLEGFKLADGVEARKLAVGIPTAGVKPELAAAIEDFQPHCFARGDVFVMSTSVSLSRAMLAQAAGGGCGGFGLDEDGRVALAKCGARDRESVGELRADELRRTERRRGAGSEQGRAAGCGHVVCESADCVRGVRIEDPARGGCRALDWGVAVCEVDLG